MPQVSDAHAFFSWAEELFQSAEVYARAPYYLFEQHTAPPERRDERLRFRAANEPLQKAGNQPTLT
jgi:hypothetical protein